MIFGLTLILWPDETQILYWSNFFQLVFLLAITVGTAIMNRDSERRAIEDHRTIRREFDLPQEAHGMLNKSLQEIAVGARELLVHANQGGTEGLRALSPEAGGLGNHGKQELDAARPEHRLPDCRIAEDEQHVLLAPAEGEVRHAGRRDLAQEITLRREHLHPAAR